VRSKLLWTIDSGTSLTLAAMYSHAYAPNLQGGALIPGELTVVGTPGYNGFYNTTTNNDLRTGTDQQNYSATFKHDLGFATLTSITSRDFVHFRLTTEKDLSPVPLLNLNINSLSYSWTQEFQLASNGDGPLKWTLGAFITAMNSRRCRFRSRALPWRRWPMPTPSPGPTRRASPPMVRPPMRSPGAPI
jgi:iron complex outermembrane receptor protein